MHDREMSLTDHLTELRKRLMTVLVTVAVLFLGGFFVTKPVVHWLILRAHVKRIIVTGVPEAFFALLKVDLVMSLVLASPIILYQAAAFILPGLTEVERKVVAAVLGPGLLLFLSGMAAGFFLFVPVVLHVMLTFVGGGIEEYWSIGNYLSFVVNLTVPFGFVAELPLVAGVLARQGVVSPKLFRRYRRYAILIAFLISAILAPPDALSMIVMAMPLYLVYEVSGLVTRLLYRPPDFAGAQPDVDEAASANPFAAPSPSLPAEEEVPPILFDGPWDDDAR
ncbi:MAG: twin-arginine translocase subunit TatC [Thermaerobacter sp.]|nr:twin-arginine translocase subunit TatC [Thermaerobacter sp.]